jgi:hypothetical protein
MDHTLFVISFTSEKDGNVNRWVWKPEVDGMQIDGTVQSVHHTTALKHIQAFLSYLKATLCGFVCAP